MFKRRYMYLTRATNTQTNQKLTQGDRVHGSSVDKVSLIGKGSNGSPGTAAPSVILQSKSSNSASASFDVVLDSFEEGWLAYAHGTVLMVVDSEGLSWRAAVPFCETAGREVPLS